MEFDYIYEQINVGTFVRLPNILLEDELFQELNITSKIVYSKLLDRVGLSIKCCMVDDDGRIYVVYPVQLLAKDLNVSPDTITNHTNTLQEFGLIEKKKRGFNRPDFIHVKNFMTAELEQKYKGKSFRIKGKAISKNMNSNENNPIIIGKKIPGSGNGKTLVLETEKFSPNQTIYQTMSLYDKSYQSYQFNEEQEQNELLGLSIEDIKTQIYLNLGIELLKNERPDDQEILDEIFQLVIEKILCSSETIRVSQSELPAEKVKEALLHLTPEHICYVIDSLKAIPRGSVKNPRSYLLTCLFEAPKTIGMFHCVGKNVSLPRINTHKKNRFVNYKAEDRDFEELAKFEREQTNRDLEKMKEESWDFEEQMQKRKDGNT